MKNTQSNELQHQFYNIIRQMVSNECEQKKETYNSDAEPFDLYVARKEYEALQSGKMFVDDISHAFQVIIGELKAAHDESAVQQLSQGFQRMIPEFSSMLDPTKVDTTKTIAELFGYQEPLLEKIYQIAISCFERGHIDDSHKVIRLLLLLDPGYSASWIALGLILKAQKRWEECIDALHVAQEIDQHNPIPHFHTALCHKAMNSIQNAKEALRRALTEATNNPSYKEFVPIIQSEINTI